MGILALHQKIMETDWHKLTQEINEKGYTLVSRLLPVEYCQELIDKYDIPDLYRKTIIMERHHFGFGEYKYFNYPLPDNISILRKLIYPKLVPVANAWMKMLNNNRQFPNNFDDLQKLCRENNQIKSTVLILKYGKGGYNTLHKDLYGEVFFPFQLVFFLNEPEEEYTGGEFVLTEQIPRAQSKAIVSRPHKGDMLIITTNFRPIKGTKGYYKAQMRHGVSEVHTGSRYTLGIIFHDALT